MKTLLLLLIIMLFSCSPKFKKETVPMTDPFSSLTLIAKEAQNYDGNTEDLLKYKKRYEEGDLNAQYIYAIMISTLPYGDDVEQANKLLVDAAEKGHLLAMYDLVFADVLINAASPAEINHALIQAEKYFRVLLTSSDPEILKQQAWIKFSFADFLIQRKNNFSFKEPTSLEQSVNVKNKAIMTEAFQFALDSALVGMLHPRNTVAECYLLGIGTNKNHIEAYAWTKLVLDFRPMDEEAKAIFAKIKLSQEEKRLAETRFQELKKNIPPYPKEQDF